MWETPAEFWVIQQVYINTDGGDWGYSECLQTWKVSSVKPELSPVVTINTCSEMVLPALT